MLNILAPDFFSVLFQTFSLYFVFFFPAGFTELQERLDGEAG